MEDTFGKVVAIFICVFQMFLIPLYLYDKNMERVEQTYILSEITYYVDNFRNTGIIEQEQYENMRSRIYSLSGGYDINVTHCTYEEDKQIESGESLNATYYESNIEEELSRNGIYYLRQNDYINVYVENDKGGIVGFYGGSVKNEAY